jgi:quinol monooxygenase YgiN
VNHFVIIVEFDVRPECLDVFNQAIALNARASVADEPGCRQFDVLHNEDDPNHVVLYEVYDSPAAFQEHLARNHTQTFLAAAKGLVVKQTVYRLRRRLAPPVKQ